MSHPIVHPFSLYTRKDLSAEDIPTITPLGTRRKQKPLTHVFLPARAQGVVTVQRATLLVYTTVTHPGRLPCLVYTVLHPWRLPCLVYLLIHTRGGYPAWYTSLYTPSGRLPCLVYLLIYTLREATLVVNLLIYTLREATMVVYLSIHPQGGIYTRVIPCL